MPLTLGSLACPLYPGTLRAGALFAQARSSRLSSGPFLSRNIMLRGLILRFLHQGRNSLRSDRARGIACGRWSACGGPDSASRLNLELGVDAERRESPLFQMQQQGAGTDQRVLGRATVQW